jgi:hypothetical protein
MELAEKLEAALVKYLQSLAPSPFPEWFDPANQVKPGETDEDLDRQYIRCRADVQAEEEYPQQTGNFWWRAEVEARTPSASQTAAEAASESPLESIKPVDQHKAIATIVENALLVDDLAEQLTAAAAALGEGYELTVFAVRDRQPARAQDDEVYSSGQTFRLYCCSIALT